MIQIQVKYLTYGKNIKALKNQILKETIGLVLQQDLIFSESIYDNIQFNRSKIEQMDVELATSIAQAGFIYERDGDFSNQMASRGMNLSGGQKQRILIARAIAGKPELLILDDASSALDYQTDMKMRKALDESLKDTTKIIIAQRISSLKDADQILVLDEGRIIASGTHESFRDL